MTEHPANPPFAADGAVVVVTGGASGIGRALARRFHSDGAAAVVLADLDAGHATDVAAQLADAAGSAEGPPGEIVGVSLDVADAEATRRLVEELTERHGTIDLWCANAGLATGAGADAPITTWQRCWEVHVLGVVHAAAVLVPQWSDRGSGHLLVTASAAGLLTNLGDAPYSTTKHAAVALAEWLAITHGPDGVGVSCLCPQGVRTPLLFGEDAEESLAARAVTDQRILEPDEVADMVAEALGEGRFLILPHEEVSRYEQVRAGDHDRWIRGMRKLASRLSPP